MSHGLIHDSEHTRFKWMMLISLHINDFIDSQVMVIRTDCRNSEVFRFAPHEGKARTLLLNNGNFTMRKKNVICYDTYDSAVVCYSRNNSNKNKDDEIDLIASVVS